MPKARSPIFRLCDEYYQKSLEHNVIAATYAHDHTQDDEWNDYAYHQEDPFLPVVQTYYKKISKEVPQDKYDEIAQKVILTDLEDYISNANDLREQVYFGSVFSDIQSIYDVFSVMPRKTKKDEQNILKRMEKIPTALTQWVSGLNDISKLGVTNAKLRVEYMADILENYAEGKFTAIALEMKPDDKDLLKAAKEADIACATTAAWLRQKYLPIATEEFWLGEERYIRHVKSYTGLTIDPQEVYRWGFEELRRIHEEMWQIAKVIAPKARKLTDVADVLNSDPKYIIEDKKEFQKFLDGITKQAIKDMRGTYFVIPQKIAKCEVVLDEDTIDESPYYLDPSDDLTRHGRTLYPTVGRTTFTTWENYSTWFHESVPGHHMQIATSILNKETLTKYQRTDGWNSGYGEGWALYSERLMDELGYFSDPGYKMGYLLCQALRAARLVVDVGLHLQYKDPKGKRWTPDSAVRFMKENALLRHDYAVSEVKRYISWGGQAVTYKLGERVWFESREEAKRRLGESFDLKKFHMYALRLGPMHLDSLREELARWDGKETQ